MRLVIFLMFVQVGNLMAVDMYAQSRKLTLKMENSTIKEVLDEISRNSDYIFFYGDDVVELDRGVDLDVTDSTIEQALRALFGATGHMWTIRDRQVIINRAPQPQQPQRTTVHGRVVDQAGSPLTGANIAIRGTTRGVTADADGHFELEVVISPETVLDVSYVGMESREIVMDRARDLDIVLQEASHISEEVLVTGYYSLPRERSAGSFTAVEGKQLTLKANTSVLERLAGLVPGLTVNPSGDDKLLIRGANSINSNRAPLFVVDGMPIELSELESTVSADDIQIVNVLKDAAAASIWGVRASNGVIVLTTKRGRMTAGQKTSVDYSGTLQVRGLPDFDYLNYMNAREYVDFAIMQAEHSPVPDETNLLTPIERIYQQHKAGTITDAQRDAAYDKLRNSDNTAQIEKYLYQPRIIHQHNIGISGGSDKASYFISANYRHTRPDRVGQSEDRLIFNAKNDIRLARWATFSFDANVMYDDARSKYTPDVVGMVPYELLRDEATGDNISQTHMFYGDEDKARLDAELNSRKMMTYGFSMLDELDRQTNKSQTLHARVQAKLALDLLDGLRFESTFQYQRGSGRATRLDHADSFRVLNMIAQYTPIAAGSKSLIPTGGRMDKTWSFSDEWVARNQFSYNRTVNDRHHITALAGTEVRKRNAETENRVMYGYSNNPFITYANIDQATLAAGIGSGIADPQNPTNQMPSNEFGTGIVLETPRFFSLYGNFAYDFDNRYALNASMRIDQANTFGTGVRWKPVWSAGAVWNISREEFFRSNVFDRLSARVSYGVTGMIPNATVGGPYDLIMSENDANYIYDYPNMVMLMSPANDDLEWEKTRSLNIGADYSMLGGRLRGSLDVYFKKTKDLIAPKTIDPTLGFPDINVNVADMRNTGVELSIISRNIARRDFTWETMFNFAYNKSKVTDVYRAMLIDNYVNSYRPVFIKDHPAYAIFSYRYAGLNDDGEPMVYDAEDNKTAEQITDVNAVVYSGTAQPPFSGGMTNTFRYRNFTLEVQLLFNLGHKMRRDVPDSNIEVRVGYNREAGNREPWISPLHKGYLDAWTPDNTDTNVPRWQTVWRSTDYYYPAADINIISASYIAVNDITLSYALPTGVAHRLGMSGCTVSAQVNNPFIWTKNSDGIDPRYMANMVGRSRRLKYGPEYMFRLNVQF